jgi:site-specific recombinase XerD
MTAPLLTAQQVGELDRIEDANVVVVLMLTPTHAVDLFLGDLSRRSRSQSGRTVDSYRRLLDKFTDSLGTTKDVTEITSDDCRRFLDLNARGVKGRPVKPGTQAHTYAVLNSFLGWLYQQQRIKKNPLDHVPRPRRPHPDTLDVTTVATVDVPKLLAAARTWTERLAIAIPVYTGARRSAVAQLRLADYNPERGYLRFHEKGDKTIWKPVPDELRTMLDSMIAQGVISDPGDYLVPAEGGLVKPGNRDNRVIWRAVKVVADRAGIDAHVHALRAAFATFYLETHTGDVEGLKEHMGHESIATTQAYLRRLDKQAAMERNRSMSWGVQLDNELLTAIPQNAGKRLESALAVGAGGFEPPNHVLPLEHRAGSKQRADS